MTERQRRLLGEAREACEAGRELELSLRIEVVRGVVFKSRIEQVKVGGESQFACGQPVRDQGVLVQRCQRGQESVVGAGSKGRSGFFCSRA